MFSIESHRILLLRGLYAANILGAGVPGLLMTFAPAFASTTMFWSPQDPAVFSILGSVWLAIGLVSMLGVMYPLRFLGIFVVQLVYKTIWLATFMVPALAQGTFRSEAWVMVGIFVFLIVGALLVVPFKALLGGDQMRPTNAVTAP